MRTETSPVAVPFRKGLDCEGLRAVSQPRVAVSKVGAD